MKGITPRNAFWTLCLIGGLGVSGCASPKHVTTMPRLTGPPAGKALVNIHRLAVGPIRNPIFDETGKFLMDLPGKSACQLVFEPGQKSIITWYGANPINVITLDLAPDKTYDLVFTIHPLKGVSFVPISKAAKNLQNWQTVEKKAPTVYVLDRDAEALAFEAKQQEHIKEIVRDFRGGMKSDRVVHVSKEDCRAPAVSVTPKEAGQR